MNCKNCNQTCCKWGKQKNGAQRYYCKACKKAQQQEYKYAACKAEVTAMIPRLVCESVSIRGIARILSISQATVLKKIKQFASAILKPPIPLNCKILELDEVRTFIKKKKTNTG